MAQPVVKKNEQPPKEDKRVGEAFNELFKDKANFKDPQVMENFWTEIKDRLVRRYGTMQDAFRALNLVQQEGETAPPPASGLHFLEFSDMLRSIQIPLEMRICRTVFEKASGHGRAIPFEAFKNLLMDRTIRKLRFVMEGFNHRQEAIQRHCGWFLRRIALGDPYVASQAVDRFQRKLTPDFCRGFWKMMLAYLKTSASPNLILETKVFQQMIKKAVIKSASSDFRLQAYDAVFMLRTYHRINMRLGKVSICDLMAMLILMSPESDRCQKVKLLFEVFDSDYDGCLLWDQLLALFRCFCRVRPVAQEAGPETQDGNFQEELSSQEGLRAYETTRWFLQRWTRLEGSIVSLRELWEALVKQPALMDTLLPGAVTLEAWALEACPAEREEDDAAHSQPAVEAAAASPPPTSGPRASMGAVGHNEVPAKAREGPRPTVSSRAQTPDESNNDILQMLQTRKSRLDKKMTVSMPVVREQDDLWDFRSRRVNEFQSTLQNFGVLREAELERGFLLHTKGVDLEAEEGANEPKITAMSRSSSAPSGIKGGRRSRPGSEGGRGGHAAITERLPGSSISKKAYVQRWGTEAVDRFRLFAAVRGGFETSRLAAPEKGVGYMCQLCQRPHTFNMDCRR
eukprot:TRINITY_DN75036_c0_g1_i1.p1 TRINITY_DN75036_c0_g1~~TRINITY_DN75036_c0_g1_i1.p1  ORF type:complete len:627 (-),score=116.00 TRINITY_DN75036_c0_g1_i1:102-1982(-)